MLARTKAVTNACHICAVLGCLLGYQLAASDSQRQEAGRVEHEAEEQKTAVAAAAADEEALEDHVRGRRGDVGEEPAAAAVQELAGRTGEQGRAVTGTRARTDAGVLSKDEAVDGLQATTRRDFAAFLDDEEEGQLGGAGAGEVVALSPRAAAPSPSAEPCNAVAANGSRRSVVSVPESAVAESAAEKSPPAPPSPGTTTTAPTQAPAPPSPSTTTTAPTQAPAPPSPSTTTTAPTQAPATSTASAEEDEKSRKQKELAAKMARLMEARKALEQSRAIAASIEGSGNG